MPLSRRVGSQVSASAWATVIDSEGGGKLSISAMASDICRNLIPANAAVTSTQAVPVINQDRQLIG